MKLLGLSRLDVRKALKEGKVTIAVYGLGKMGLPLALVFAEAGARVVGVDVNSDVVRAVNSGENYLKGEPGVEELLRKHAGKRLTATTNLVEAAEVSDVMVVIVPTLVGEGGVPDLAPLYRAINGIARGLEKGDIVIVESTVPPGTCEQLGARLEAISGLAMGIDFGVAHAPERTMSGRVIQDITESYPKIVGASDRATLEAVIGIYEVVNKRGVIPLSSLRAAEAVKVFEGVYRNVNIALANELARYAERMGFDVMEAIEAANTQPYSHIHKPGAGVGGHCIPVYPYFLIHTGRRVGVRLPLIETACMVNESMPSHLVWLVVRALNDSGMPVRGTRILVLGLTYRPGVKEYRYAPSLRVLRELAELGAELYAYDPLTEDALIERFGAKPWKGEEVDAVVIVTEYEEFRELVLKRHKGMAACKVVVDGRRLIKPEEAEASGYSYWAIGWPLR